MTVLSDHPSVGDELRPDRLELESRLSAVFDILRHRQTRCPITVAIYGDWGTGKTSAMRWLETQLRHWNTIPSEQRDGHMKVHPIWFDPWRYHSREEVWRGIIAEVILSLFSVKNLDRENLPTRMREAAKMFGAFLGRGFLQALANVEIKAGSSAAAEVSLKGEVFRDIYDEYEKAAQPAKAHLNQFESTLRSWVEKFLTNKDGEYTERIAIFIDDLDRCLPPVTLEVLEAIKLYLNIEPMAFVVGLDRSVVDSVVQKHYKESGVGELKSREYLNKLFQIDVMIPPSETQMQGYLTIQIEALNQATGGFWAKMLGDRDKNPRSALEKSLSKLARHNPREIKRLLNSALILGRSAADRSGIGGEESRGQRFAQGVQFFLLQRLIQDRVSESSGLLRTDQHLDWFKSLSEFASKIFPIRPTSDDVNDALQLGRPEQWHTEEDAEESRKSLSADQLAEFSSLLKARPTNDLDLQLDPAFFFSDVLWDLMLVPFSVEVAQFAPVREVFGRKTTVDPEKQDGSPFSKLSPLIVDRLGTAMEKPVQELSDSDLSLVTELNLSESEIDDGALATICNFASLHSLKLDSTEVTNAGLVYVSKLRSLKKLWLDDLDISDEGLQEIAKLDHLENLTLNRTSISDDGLKHIAGLRCLQVLSLNGTKITDRGLQEIGKISSLRVLSLIRTQISDQGLQFVAKLPNLGMLRLDRTRITDVGLSYLTAMSVLDMLSLKRIENVTEQGISKLKEALPRIAIQA